MPEIIIDIPILTENYYNNTLKDTFGLPKTWKELTVDEQTLLQAMYLDLRICKNFGFVFENKEKS